MTCFVKFISWYFVSFRIDFLVLESWRILFYNWSGKYSRCTFSFRYGYLQQSNLRKNGWTVELKTKVALRISLFQLVFSLFNCSTRSFNCSVSGMDYSVRVWCRRVGCRKFSMTSEEKSIPWSVNIVFRISESEKNSI